ncbi:hypothetical protein AAG906_007211 [Vitis piasezkii]
MEVEKTSTLDNKRDDDEEVELPGFRFHPTDEELVGFYLRRKVEKKPISLELIKQVDIYKYDPWDLPRVSTKMGDREWYFFCIRGRKYRNSIRPNRVTGSGFWKATGIDKPIYSVEATNECIGLKKSLVYYRGSAGKGTKTDWMMHEFRLPPGGKGTYFPNAKNVTQEAEVWTLCRIFKRSPTYRKYTPEGKGSISNKQVAADSSSKTCSLESDNNDKYLSFENSTTRTKNRTVVDSSIDERSQLVVGQMSSFVSPYSGPYSSFWNPNGDDQFFTSGNWDELRSIVESAIDPPHVYDCR